MPTVLGRVAKLKSMPRSKNSWLKPKSVDSVALSTKLVFICFEKNSNNIAKPTPTDKTIKVEFIKITAGTDAVFQVKSIPNYQPIYTWDYSAAPSGVHFLNPLPGAIQIEVDPFLESTSFWWSYSYEDIDCMISDSIQIQVIGIDVFDTANGNHLLCASDLGSPLDIQTDLDFVDLAFDILDENGILLFQQLVEWPAGLTTGDYILDVSWQDLIESCPLCLILSDNTMQIPIYVNLDK